MSLVEELVEYGYVPQEEIVEIPFATQKRKHKKKRTNKKWAKRYGYNYGFKKVKAKVIRINANDFSTKGFDGNLTF